MRTVKITLMLLLCSTLLGACGLKGPLYLPEDKRAAEQAAPADAEAADKEKAKEKKKDSGGGPATRR